MNNRPYARVCLYYQNGRTLCDRPTRGRYTTTAIERSDCPRCLKRLQTLDAGFRRQYRHQKEV